MRHLSYRFPRTHSVWSSFQVKWLHDEWRQIPDYAFSVTRRRNERLGRLREKVRCGKRLRCGDGRTVRHQRYLGAAHFDDGYRRVRDTQADQPASSPYKPNNNVVVAPLSFFYGGAITDHVGAFAQITYNNAAFGGSAPGAFNPDPCANCEWSWDNVDVRYADPPNWATWTSFMASRQQQSDRARPVKHDTRMGLSLCRFNNCAWAGGSSAHRRDLCGICRRRRRLCLHQ